MTPDDLVGLYATAHDPPSLSGLGAADWSAVSHAYGPATDVPAMLRALVSAVPDHRDFATELLFQTVWHQGTVYAATAAVVPFLYRLLEAPEVPAKDRVAVLIATVADGSSYTAVHDRTPEQVAQAWASLAAGADGQDVKLIRELGHVAAVMRAVSARLDMLYPYLRNPDAEVRRCVAVALGLFPEHAARSIFELWDILRDEQDKDARDLMNEAVERLRRAPGGVSSQSRGHD